MDLVSRIYIKCRDDVPELSFSHKLSSGDKLEIKMKIRTCDTHILSFLGQQMQRESNTAPPLNTGFGTNYQNSSFGGADRNKAKSFTPQVLTSINSGKLMIS